MVYLMNQSDLVVCCSKEASRWAWIFLDIFDAVERLFVALEPDHMNSHQKMMTMMIPWSIPKYVLLY
jgi:uncharacterized protein YhbP (UPF0306 family)